MPSSLFPDADDLRDRPAHARRLTLARVALGLTQRAVAHRLGTTRSYVSGIESAQYVPSATALRRIYEVGLGIPFPEDAE